MSIKVSIITPCLNSAGTIKDTIESVLNQTYGNIEYIIVDGASTDRTVAIIDEYCTVSKGRLKYISERDNGIYDAMNKGIMLAAGDVIGIINSDDWYVPDAVEKAVGCFEKTGAGVVYGEIWVINEKNEWEYHTAHNLFPPHPSTFIRRAVYQKYGLYDTKYRIAADRDLLLHFMTKQVQFAHVDEILANFRKTGISNTNSMECAKETYEINRKYLGKCPENILSKKAVEEKYTRDKFLYVSKKRPEIIRNILSTYYNISDGLVIFGVGACGKELEVILRMCDIPIRFLVDNDEKKWGLELNGKKIFSPEILRYGSAHVIVTVAGFQADICEQLQSYLNPRLTWSVLDGIRQSAISQCNSLFVQQEISESGR